jgi:hypothetical protein
LLFPAATTILQPFSIKALTARLIGLLTSPVIEMLIIPFYLYPPTQFNPARIDDQAPFP